MMQNYFTRTMINQFGIAHKVVQVETYLPARLKAGYVQIEMQCAPINPSDIITINGAYQNRTALPMTPGFEGVGIVTQTAPDITDINIGDRVMPIRQSGTWQDIHIVPAQNCFKIDPHLTTEQAAISYINPMTAIQMVENHCELNTNTHVVLNAANSEIGHIIIKLSLSMGSKVTAFVRRNQSADELITKFGHQITIAHERDYDHPCYRHSSDVFFDAVGGPKAEKLATTLKAGGVMIHYGLLSERPLSPEFTIQRADITLKLYHLRHWVHHASRQEIEKMFQRTANMFHQNMIETRIHQSFPLKKISQVLKAYTDTDRSGKILIYPNH